MERTRKVSGCHVCASDHIKEIENDVLKGFTFTSIGREYDIHPQWISHHVKNCRGRRLARRGEKALQLSDFNVLGECKDKIKYLGKMIIKAEQEDRPTLILNVLKEERAWVTLISSIQAFLITQENSTKLTPEQIIADHEEERRHHTYAAVNCLSPIEHKVWRALCLKMIGGQRSTNIEWIDYSEEKRPYEVEDIQVTVPGEKRQAREDMAPAKTDEEYFENYESP